jgi:hypothetical protein
MNRSHFFGLLAGAAAATLAAVPAFAEDGEKGLQKALTASDERRANAKEKLQELAQRVKEAKLRAIQGTVESVTGATFVVATKQGNVTVTTNADTTYHGPGRDRASLASVVKGAHIVAQADRAAANATPTPATLLARRIVILPARKERPQRMVTVGSVTNLTIASDGKGSFTLNPVTPAGSPAVTFVVDADTVYTLKGIIAFANGQRARVVSVKNDGGQNVARQVRVPAGD